jgi:HD-GYP domain-containing protein (c-di-GMP phosphodiesterase class II)
VGYRILSKVKEYNEIANTVLHHHERWDGTGYPEGLKGNEIPLNSRIIAVCDTFDAMTNKRPYREPLSRIYARTEIVKHSGSQFDPEIADAFVRLLDKGVID